MANDKLILPNNPQSGVEHFSPEYLYTQFEKHIDRGEATERAYRINFRQFVAWLRYKNIYEPTRDDIIDFREWLLSDHPAIEIDPDPMSVTGWCYRLDRNGNEMVVRCKPSTVAEYIRSVCQVFRWASAEYGIPDIGAAVQKPRVSNRHKKDFLSPHDVVAIEQSILSESENKEKRAESAQRDKENSIQRSTEQGKRLYAMFLLAVNAGLRTIEISRARVKDLETKNGQTYLYIWGKGHSEADAKKAIVPEIKAAIEDYLASRTDAYTGDSPLFVSTGNRSGGKRIAPTTISTMLKKAMVEAGYDSNRLTAHSLRHTTGQNVMEITDSNIYNTQQYMRHANPKTTEIYLENSALTKDAEIARELYDHYHGESNK